MGCIIRGVRAADPVFFTSPADWRTWLEANHESATELWVGMWKAHTKKPSLTWAQAVREALCFGWIDGQMHRIDDESHAQRFTPRKPTSKWSAVNVRLVGELEEAGLMRDAGRRAFEARDATVEPYSTSDRPAQLPAGWDARLRDDPAAGAFWDATPPSYRKTVAFWLTEAKREATREKRFAELAAACARGERLARFVS